MKKKLAFLVLMICMLTLGLVFVGCNADGGGSGNSGGGDIPAELQGTWVGAIDQSAGNNVLTIGKNTVKVGGSSWSGERTFTDVTVSNGVMTFGSKGNYTYTLTGGKLIFGEANNSLRDAYLTGFYRHNPYTKQ